MTFHWDPQPFQDLLKASNDGPLDLWIVSGEPLDRVFTASAYAIAQSVIERTALAPEKFMEMFLEAVTVVGHVLESAFMGLLIEAGESDPRKYFVKESD